MGESAEWKRKSSHALDAAGDSPVPQRQQEQLLTNAVSLDEEEEVSSSSSVSTVERTHSRLGNPEWLDSEQHLENMVEGDVPALPSHSQILQQQQQQQLNNTGTPNNNNTATE